MKNSSVHITKIINGGYGLGRLDDGQIIMVRHTLPDETVIVNIQERKKNLLFGKLSQIITSHPERRNPPCPYYQKCGGCDLQHCHYPLQTAIKKSLLLDLLDRLGSAAVSEAAARLQAPLPSPSEFGYRQRIQLKSGKAQALGFHGFRTNDVVDVEQCLLARPEINDALRFLRSDRNFRKLRECLTGTELLFNSASKRVIAIVTYSRKPRPNDIKTAAALCSTIETIEAVYFSGDGFALTGPIFSSGLAGEDSCHLAVNYDNLLSSPVNLSWEVGGFCQVNLAQNENMIKTVLNYAAVKPGDTVLDLFCGMGNFSLPLAMQGAIVTGYEGQGAAVRSAILNAHRADCSSAQFHKMPVHLACDELAKTNRKFDTVVIDPPRQGGAELAARLWQLTRKKLIYVSCDPATLCRDLNDLSAQGFTLTSIQPIDMFPQTHHIETIALLQK